MRKDGFDYWLWVHASPPLPLPRVACCTLERCMGFLNKSINYSFLASAIFYSGWHLGPACQAFWGEAIELKGRKPYRYMYTAPSNPSFLVVVISVCMWGRAVQTKSLMTSQSMHCWQTTDKLVVCAWVVLWAMLVCPTCKATILAVNGCACALYKMLVNTQCTSIHWVACGELARGKCQK